MATAYAEAVGRCFMITPDMLEHLSAWNSYYRVKGMGRPTAPYQRPVKSQWRIMMGLRGHYAVPAEWPWMFDQSIDEVHLGDYKNPMELRRLKGLLEKTPLTSKARPETKASCDAFLRDRGVDHLPQNHEDRRAAVADWGRWYLRQPSPKPYAPNDPVRDGPPKGWRGVV